MHRRWQHEASGTARDATNQRPATARKNVCASVVPVAVAVEAIVVAVCCWLLAVAVAIAVVNVAA